jgi:methyl-accepting chemotaxis protein
MKADLTDSAPAGADTIDHGSSSKLGARDNLADAHTRQLLAAMVAFRDGDFSVRLPSDWDGINGRIAEAFNHAMQYEDQITREAKRLRTNVGKEGRLKQRMSLPGAVGEWAVKVESINTLIDDLVRPTADVARTIGAVAKGDLGQSMAARSGASSCARPSWSTR